MGAYLTVSDEEVLEAMRSWRRGGVFANPPAATGYAGLAKAIRENLLVDPDEDIVVVVTGNGLKGHPCGL